MSSNSGLQQQHLQQLRASALSEDVVAQRGYWTATSREEVEELGFAPYQCKVPALVIPLFNPRGEPAGFLSRPDRPRVRDGKPIKYEAIAGAPPVLDLHPLAVGWLEDPALPLVITEGVKKADAAVSKGFPALGLLGVYGWRGRNAAGGTAALAAWEWVPLRDREVLLVFDSDLRTNRNVHVALIRLADFLGSRGAKVKIVYLPDGPNGVKTGLDDFFARGGTTDELLRMAEVGASSRTTTVLVPQAGPSQTYFAEEDGLYVRRATRQGLAEDLKLTSFLAQIEEEVVKDPEDEPERFYGIRARVDGAETSFEVPAEEFTRLEWIPKHLGARAIVAAGMGVGDHVRAAIQSISTPSLKHVYSSLGWVLLDGVPHFRHVGGAIGPNGNREDVLVEPPPELRAFRLPPPPTRDGLREAFAAVLRLKSAFDSETFWRLFALVAAAPLSDFLKLDFVAWAYGGTGKLKSTSAALFSNFFGAVTRLTLPGNFRSTTNALESRGHRAKNCLFVVDDYLPTNDRNERQERERLATSIIRQVGDNQGRARLTRDLKDRRQRPYRGCVLVTAEVPPPGGTSTQARCFLIPWDQTRIDRQRLAEAEAKDTQKYRAFMAAYLRFVATTWGDLETALPETVMGLRAASQKSHARLSESRAKLHAALHIYALFAADSGLLSREAASEHLEEAEEALEKSTEATSARERDERPANRLVEAIRTLLSEKLAFFENEKGGEPQHAERWGWVERSQVDSETGILETGLARPQGGTRIGRVDQRARANIVYILPDIVRKLVADKLRLELPTADELGASLQNEGLLAARDPNRFQKSVRLGGPPVRTLAIHLRAFDDPDHPSEPEALFRTKDEPVP